MRFHMRKPCWGWNDPSIEEVRMAAFHVRCSRCWLVGLMLSCVSRAMWTDGTSPGFHMVSINTSSHSPEGSWNMKSKYKEQRREKISEQTKHAQSNSSTRPCTVYPPHKCSVVGTPDTLSNSAPVTYSDQTLHSTLQLKKAHWSSKLLVLLLEVPLCFVTEKESAFFVS